MTHSNPQAHPNLDLLLEHSGWVRALARSLVADQATAEDLEQKAWLAAIEKPPHHLDQPRAWMTTVVRNLAKMQWRENKARGRREETAGAIQNERNADWELAQRPERVAEKMETLRTLAAALVELEEPYGTLLFLRFFEELPMRAIGEQMHVPESTVRARMQRGLDLLRADLKNRMGQDWRAHCLTLTAPLASIPVATKVVASGASFALGSKVIAFLFGGLVLGLGLVAYANRDQGPLEESHITAQAPIKKATNASTKKSGLVATEILRTDITPGTGKTPWSASVMEAGTVQVQVLGATGNPVQGVPIALGFLEEEKVEELQQVLTDSNGVAILRDASEEMPLQRDYVVGFPFPLKDGPAPHNFSNDDWPGERLSLELPETGSVEISLLSPDGESWPHEERVRLASGIADANSDRPIYAKTLANLGVLSKQGMAVFPHVGLDMELVVSIQRHDWAKWRQSPIQPGPVRAGGVVPFTLRALEWKPVIRMKLLEESGAPVSARTVHVSMVTATARPGSSQKSTSGSNEYFSTVDGRLEIPITRGYGDGIHTLFLLTEEQDGPLLHTTILLPNPLPLPWDSIEKRFDIELGHQTMKAQQLLAAGQLHDADGLPLQGEIEVHHEVHTLHGDYLHSRFDELPGLKLIMNEDGSFQCFGISDSKRLHLKIAVKGFLTQKHIVDSKAEDQDFEFLSDLGVVGRIIIPAGFLPEDFVARYFPKGTEASAFMYGSGEDGLVQEDGSFRVGSLEDQEPGTIGILHMPTMAVVAQFDGVVPQAGTEPADDRLNPVRLDGLMTAHIKVKSWNGEWISSMQYVVLNYLDKVEPKELWPSTDEFSITTTAPSVRIRLYVVDHKTMELDVHPGENLIQLEQAWQLHLQLQDLPLLDSDLQYIIKPPPLEGINFGRSEPKLSASYGSGRKTLSIETPGEKEIRIGIRLKTGTNTMRYVYPPEWRFLFEISPDATGLTLPITLSEEIAQSAMEQIRTPLNHNH